ncbi:uncharacterized protein C8R40DRAFT_1178820 [Lentinula edodes]|uniref:uncharacterized protein n=1 Tax=Lentinula edodes TaxID=5353 RepID=UPI001E8EA875|nr:uncharacterized protein C8R40DRAFT_1178820 [Lentinula edodes]KAH7867668.1 hypothetical protein C8R40DRAFT_1178820 [Lentinula edodes]
MQRLFALFGPNILCSSPLTGPLLYVTPQGERKLGTKAGIDIDNVSSKLKKRKLNKHAEVEDELPERIVTMLTTEIWVSLLVYASISVGAQYDYKLMPDYSGKLFALNKARLLQPDWRKIDGELIVPVKSMPRASTPPLGTPKIHSYCNLTLIVLSRYTYPLVLVPPYCLLLYPAGTTRIAPNS